MAEYVHPSISSTITDNSITYVTASGTTKLFAAFTSEKGPDNKIKMITSVTEFEFYYGEPNIKLYGQVGYNIINWLQSGGVVYCLRVLPDDAGYSNAIVNIQTKVSTKTVYDVDGNEVSVNDVTLRPTVTYTNTCNNTESAIEIDALRDSTNTSNNPKTIDGYTNNMLFAVIPKGRGQGYNDLGFRITAVSGYDSTYEFRLYNFEVTQINSSGSTSTVEGPFLVSLDPDALSISGESMFIVDVIDKYSEYFKIIFNETNYEALAEIINPNVHPNRIDFFNGISRKIDGEYETYYDEVTGKDEDVHISVIKYDINHQPTLERNIVDPTDDIEAAIVLTDNTYRKAQYTRYTDALDIMKNALSKIKKAKSGNPIQTILSSKIEALQNATDVDDAYNQAAGDVSDLNASATNDNYNTSLASITAVNTTISNKLNDLYEVFDYARIIGSSDTSISAMTALDSVDSAIYVISNKSIKYSSFTQDINSLSTEKESVIEGTNAEKEEYTAKVITEVSDILAQLEIDQVASDSITFADNTIAEVTTKLTELEGYYDELTGAYTTDEDYANALASIFGGTVTDSDAGTSTAVDGVLKTLFTTVKFAINLTFLEFEYDKLLEVKDDVSTAVTTVTNLGTVITDADYKFDTDEIIATLTLFESSVLKKQQDCYRTVIQNYDSNISLLFGTDGNIEDSLPSSSEVEKLIVKGYLGTIDDGLLDKDIYPIDVVLDANYSTTVKNALITLTTDIRSDFVAILDTKCQATPEQAIAYRRSSLSVSNFRVSIFTQDFVVTDSEYTGQRIQVTAPYFLASKIPSNDANNGIHYNFVGPRRGTISGFESISFLPNPEWQEQLYNAQINYVIQDSKSTRFNSQLTSQSVVSALSNINNVRALLRIQREVEELMADYQFEYNDSTTRSEAQLALNSYLSKWTTNRACDSISGLVYASDYDRQQKIMRVKVEIVFNSVIERIAIDLIVNN
jgi:hypothetical protein